MDNTDEVIRQAHIYCKRKIIALTLFRAKLPSHQSKTSGEEGEVNTSEGGFNRESDHPWALRSLDQKTLTKRTSEQSFLTAILSMFYLLFIFHSAKLIANFDSFYIVTTY